MTVKTFTLATIIYCILNFSLLPDLLLFRLSMWGGPQNFGRHNLQTKICVLGPNIEADSRRPISSLVRTNNFNPFYLSNNFFVKWHGLECP